PSTGKSTPTNATSTTGGISIKLPPLPTAIPSTPGSASLTPVSTISVSSGASGPISSGTGAIPTGFPHYFSFGATNSPGAVNKLDEQRSQNGTSYAFRYQYLAGGANTGHGWETWNQPSGQFATYYMQESAQHGYIPAFVYYEICQSNGPLG